MISVAQRVVQWADDIGCGKFVFKSDQEPAMRELQQISKDQRIKFIEEISMNVKSILGIAEEEENIVAVENSPVGESKCNGVAESAIKRFQGQVCTIKLALAEVVGAKLDIQPNIWQWLVEFAAETFSRYKVGNDGLTPYKRIKGRD